MEQNKIKYSVGSTTISLFLIDMFRPLF